MSDGGKCSMLGTFEKYDIDPLLNICMGKNITDNLLPFIILYYPKNTETKTVIKLGEYKIKTASC